MPRKQCRQCKTKSVRTSLCRSSSSLSAKCESFVFDFWSEEYAIYIVLLEGILRAFQLSIPSLRCLSILKSTLRRRAHHEEGRIRSAIARCACRFGTIFAGSGTCRRETLDDQPDENIRFAVIRHMRRDRDYVRVHHFEGLAGAWRAQAPRHRVAAK